MPLHLKTFEVAKEAGKKGEAVVSRTPLTCCLNIQALSYNSHQVMYAYFLKLMPLICTWMHPVFQYVIKSHTFLMGTTDRDSVAHGAPWHKHLKCLVGRVVTQWLPRLIVISSL